jgi:hypothetical protein
VKFKPIFDLSVALLRVFGSNELTLKWCYCQIIIQAKMDVIRKRLEDGWYNFAITVIEQTAVIPNLSFISGQ